MLFGHFLTKFYRSQQSIYQMYFTFSLSPRPRKASQEKVPPASWPREPTHLLLHPHPHPGSREGRQRDLEALMMAARLQKVVPALLQGVNGAKGEEGRKEVRGGPVVLIQTLFQRSPPPVGRPSSSTARWSWSRRRPGRSRRPFGVQAGSSSRQPPSSGQTSLCG